MRFHALACSYDSTIAGHGRVDPATTAALRRVLASGRHLILLSRRPLPELLAELPPALFVMVVADNGAVLYHPDTEQIEHLVPDPGAADKTVGLRAALTALCLSPRNLVAVGAAANDLAYLQHAEFSVAVANAPMALREQVDHVTTGEAGAGVSELVTALITGDLASLKPRRPRRILVGANLAGTQFTIPVHGTNLLLAGTSGSGKSTLMTGLLERINIQGYQFCALDPEGDHQHFPGADHFGDRHHAPTPDDVLTALAQPDRSVVVNLLAVALQDLPVFLRRLLRRLQELRTHTGRPHWLLLEEANHFLPLPTQKNAFHVPRWLDGMILAAVNPEHVAPDATALADVVLAFGQPWSVLTRYADAIGEQPPTGPAETGHEAALDKGTALLWERGPGRLHTIRAAGGNSRRQPHLRRWAEAPLIEEKAFRFRGPDNRLNLPARTLSGFLDLAHGVDDHTWLHHLHRGEYSTWLREVIHDDLLADAIAAIETDQTLTTRDSRAHLSAAFHRWYRQ